MKNTKSTNSEKRKAISFLVIGTLSFGFSSVFIKLCKFPPTVIASLRILIAGLVILPFCYRDLKITLVKSPMKLLLLFIPGLLLGLHFQLWVIGIKLTLVATGTFIFSINPIFFAIGAALFYRERLSLSTTISLVLVLSGSLWLFVSKGGIINPDEGMFGAIICFLSMLLFVFYLIAVKQFASNLPHLLIIHIIYLWGGLLTLPITFVTGDIYNMNLGDITSVIFLLALVIFPTLIGHTSNNYAVRYFSPLFVSFFTLAEPILSSINAYFILHENPNTMEYPAYILFISATILYLQGSLKERKAG